MADPRTFTLIGEFKDGITPELAKINDQLNRLKSSFSGIGSRKNTGFRGATNDIGKLISAHKNLSQSIKDVESDLRSTLGTLKQYRSEMGKAARATHAFQKAGGNLGSNQFTKNMEASNRAAQDYLRTLRQIGQESRRAYSGRGAFGGRGGYGGGGFRGGPPGAPPGAPLPRGGRGGVSRGGGAQRGGGGPDFHMGEFTFAMGISNAIAGPIESAIVTGFQIGVDLMMKPFQYFASAFGERVQDQLSDLQAAGGLFAISKRSKTPFLQTMEEAIQFQQDTNQVFAKMAATLPGVTNDYVQVGKRLSDTVARITTGDFTNALQEANRIRQTEEGRKFFVRSGEQAVIKGTGAEAQRQVMTTLLGDLTQYTTIAGIGGRTGAGGVTGAYGLPGLTERMIGQDQVSVGQFQRYAAVFSNPMVQDALNRNVDMINKTLPNTTARFQAMKKLLQEIVTPELIDQLRTSVDGVYQGLKASFLDPDTGLFGLGRQFTKFGKAMNSYGQYIDKAGNVVQNMADAADADLSLFEIAANIFSNFGQVLQPIVDFLPEVFDPLKKVASLLKDARYYTGELARTFNTYRESLLNLTKQKGFEYLKGTVDIRAALGAINNMMRALGVISQADFADMGKTLMSKTFQAGPVIKEMIDKVLNSEMATNIGKTVGEIVGTVISEVAGVTGFLSGRLKQSNNLFEGLKKGFDAAGGSEAFSNIFRDIFISMFRILGTILTKIPLEAYAFAGIAVVAPILVRTLAAEAASWLATFLRQNIGKVFPFLNKGKIPTPEGTPGRVDLSGGPGRVVDVTATTVEEAKLPGKAGPLVKAIPGMGAFAKFMNYFKGIGPRFLNFFQGWSGLLAGVGAILKTLMSLFQGKDLAQSLADGAGPLLGAALGAALIPFLGPIGPMIGAAIGSMIGQLESVTQPLADTFRAIFGTVQTTFDLIVQIGSDLIGVFNGIIRSIPGVSQGFDLLRFALFALLSPFKLLEIAISGIYDLYLNAKKLFMGGLSPEEQARLDERRTQRATDEFTIQGRQAAGYTLQQQKDAEYQKYLDAKIKGDTAAMNRSAEYMKSIVRMMEQQGVAPKKVPGGATAAAGPTAAQLAQTFKFGAPAAGPTAPAKPTTAQLAQTFAIGKPVAPTVAPWMTQAIAATQKTAVPATPKPAVPPAATVQPLQTTATSTSQINQKTGTQIKETAAVKAAVNRTTQGTQQTTQAVNNLAAKITSQSSVQQSVAAIYNLLASGATRVMATLSNLPPGFGGNGILPPGAPRPNTDPRKGQVRFPGIGNNAYGHSGVHSLGTAIATEMRNKPPGSHLVIANSSETIIPAADGFVPKMSKMGGAIAQVYYGMGAPKKKTPGGGAANWMQLIDQDYNQNVKNKPWPGSGTVRNSGRGGLDTWEGPGAYVNPRTLNPVASSRGNATPATVNAPITIYQQPGQDSEELAAIVAMKIGDAVAQARTASVYV